IASFKNEFLLLTQLKHPGLCKPHDLVYSDKLKRYLILSDFVRGEDFFKGTANKSVLEIEELAIQTLEILDYLHKHRIIHFDIKCPNILINEEKKVKLLDFGVAHLETQPLKQLAGTLFYSPPEILLKSPHTDRRVDLYSLGIVFYRALTRHFPFSEKDPGEALNWHLRKTVTWNEEEESKIPAYLRKLLEMLLKKEPSERVSQGFSAINWINLHTQNRYGEREASSASPLPEEGRLVGRQKEMEEAREALNNPAGQAFLFTGELGIGKSRLLHEIKYQAEFKEIPCLWLDRFSQKDAFSQLCKGLELPPSKTAADFFEHSLKTVHKKAPLILFADDLQDSDPLFAEWLAQVQREIGTVCLMLSWQGTLPSHGAFANLFQKAKIHPLPPLSTEEIGLYFTELLGGKKVPPEFEEWLSSFSSGIPLLVAEGARYYLEGKGEGRLPDTIENLYQNNLETLAPEAQTILETTALWRKSITLEELADSSALPMTQLAIFVPSLVERGLLNRQSTFGQMEARYQIPNEALVRLLQQRQKKLLRQKKGKRILHSTQKEKDPSLEDLVAYAFESGEKRWAKRYLLELGSYYQSTFQTRRAIENYKDYLQSFTKDKKGTLEVKKKLIPLLVLAGRPNDALRLFPPREKLSLEERKLMGWVLTRSGKFHEAAEFYVEALQESDDKDPLHSELMNALANVYVQTREFQKAITLFKTTLPSPNTPDKEKFRLLINNNLGLALSLTGQIDEARRFEKEKLELFRKLGEKHQIAVSLSQLGFIELQGQQVTDADRYFMESLSLSKELGDLHNILIMLDNLITIAQRRGRYHEAIQYLEEATRYRNLVSPPYQIIQNYLKGAFLYLNLGLSQTAHDMLCRINSLTSTGPFPGLTAWITLAWGYYYRAIQSHEKAREKFEEVVDQATKTADPLLNGWGHYALAEIYLEVRQSERSAAEYQSAAKLSDRFDQELSLRMQLLNLTLQKKGGLPPEEKLNDRLRELAKTCEQNGLMEIAAEAYAQIPDKRGGTIYQEIASLLPEEYRVAYLEDPLRSQNLRSLEQEHSLRRT
ncbi:MAG: tetratricopeptide repeat protein, partial [Deltaproteobacteria bacterium]|nr:tetratricopeptide repeat protein [Deltaproteobacteria bacterium]